MTALMEHFLPYIIAIAIVGFVLNTTYQSGKRAGVVSCIAANKAATKQKNDELAKAVEELRDLETRESEASEKAGEVLILNPAPEESCRLATPDEEKALDQLGGNL